MYPSLIYYCLTWQTSAMPAPAFEYFETQEAASKAWNGIVPHRRNAVVYTVRRLDMRYAKDAAEYERIVRGGSYIYVDQFQNR
jgi:hypothetical protein